MNARIIKIGHVAAVGIFMLVAVVVAARQGQNTSQQGGNSSQSSGQQSRNKNANSQASKSTDSNGDQNSSENMNGNTGGTTRSSAVANMSQSTGGQATGQGMNFGSADRKFVMEAAMGGMAEVELGRLASERGSSEAVKQFGQRMVDDHSRANSELTQLVSGKGVTLPTGLDAKHQALMTKMSALSGAAFDRAYAKEMVKDHNKDVALFQREAGQGTDADLKTFAQKTLPTLQEHLRMARSLPSGSGSMNGDMSGSGQR